MRPPARCPALPPWPPALCPALKPWPYVLPPSVLPFLPPLPCPVDVATRPPAPALSDAAVLRSAGRIDISILTTGLSAAGRKRRQEVAAALKKIIKERGSAPTVAYTKLYQEIREQSDIVSTAVWIVLNRPTADCETGDS